jgi:hypothetical protein
MVTAVQGVAVGVQVLPFPSVQTVLVAVEV